MMMGMGMRMGGCWWNGESWQAYRLDNSGLPSNTVNRVVEMQPGDLWVAAAQATTWGGLVARFDSQTWQVYTPHNSGYSGAEPLALAADAQGRVWMGTRTAGVDIFAGPSGRAPGVK